MLPCLALILAPLGGYLLWNCGRWRLFDGHVFVFDPVGEMLPCEDLADFGHVFVDLTLSLDGGDAALFDRFQRHAAIICKLSCWPSGIRQCQIF